MLRKHCPSPTEIVRDPFVCAKQKDRADNVTAGCKHTPLRSVASLLRKHCPRPTNVTYMRCISVAVCFSVSKPDHPHSRTSVTTYFPSADRTAPLSAYPWQPIFIPAQVSPNTIKTVGGEAVRRFFSLKYAVLLYTLSTLFTDPPLRKQKHFRKVFCQAFFQKSVNASPASPRPLASPRPHASPRPPQPQIA